MVPLSASWSCVLRAILRILLPNVTATIAINGTTDNITNASLGLIQKMNANPIISMKTPRKNSASVKEMASCICERSDEIRLLSSPTLFSVKKFIGIVSNLLYTSLRISAKDFSPTAVSK